jgi:DNA (cytosine-5)-methyltransferase 1
MDNNKIPTTKIISLFSGAMGLDLGLIQSGLNVVVSQDYDKWCAKTIEANGHVAIKGDIRELIKNDQKCTFLTRAGNIKEDEDIFAVVGGPPCQAYSTAGKRLGTEDNRGSLYLEFLHVIRELRPRFFVMENVKGLLSIDTEIQNGVNVEKVPLLDVILSDFKKIGYKTVHQVLDAVNYGAPQFRERLIIIGTRDDEDVFMPIPTHFQKHQNKDMRWKTLWDAIGDIQNKKMVFSSFTKNTVEYLNNIPMGGNWKNLSEQDQKSALGGAFTSGGGKSGFYRRLNINEPSPTLLTSPTQKSTLLAHPTESRPLSIEEYARIQQFPDNWKLEGTTDACYRQLGNAVPIPLGKAIGQMLLSVASNDSTISTKRRRLI